MKTSTNSISSNENKDQAFCQTSVMRWFTLTQLEDLENEIWVDMIGFDGIYEVSNLGRIKSLLRYVRIRNGGQRLSKENIRKQAILPDGRLSCTISYDGKLTTVNVSAIIYFSFNPKQFYPNSKFCVMHKNKIASDNRLENLILEKVSNSHKLNFAKQLLPHLAENNRKKQEQNALRTHKTCRKCNVEKPVDDFHKSDGYKCKICSALYKKELYLKKRVSQTSA